jgi:PHD/YefM family antitoxin component YafN of YafNO toxin-antitoxin module
MTEKQSKEQQEESHVYLKYKNNGKEVVVISREEWEKDWLDWYNRTEKRQGNSN